MRDKTTIVESFNTPTTDQSRRFLISFLFNGSLTPGLKECVRRAYLDLCRTAHGIGKVTDATTLKHSSHELMERIIKQATERTPAWDRESYDTWHESQCDQMRRLFEDNAFPSFCVGQAQKWLNMSVKYALTLHDVNMLNVENAGSLRRVAHVPIDNVIISALRNYSPPDLGCAWSRVRSYKTYLSYQTWCRERFKESVPLDVEFHLWIREINTQRKL